MPQMIAPPEPRSSAAAPPVAGADAVHAVLIQARRRGRRRRLASTAAAMITAAAVAAAVLWLRQAPVPSQSHGGTGPGWVIPGGGAGIAAIVWFDEAGRLHAGDIRSGGRVVQRVVAESNPAALPVLEAGGRVYWVDPAGTYVPSVGHWSQVVRYLDLVTGKTGIAGPGQTVFPSSDGTYLFMALDPWSLIRVPVRGGSQARVLNLPHGWYLPGGDGQADVVTGQGLSTANGIIVQSLASAGLRAPVLALWQPGTRGVRVLGPGRAVIGAYTPPGGHYSLLAWLPAACPLPRNCLLDITNTATMSSRTVRSPLPGGFALGGAFSPSGTALAAFVNADGRRAARLALITPGTGALRLAAAPMLPVGIDFAWARWLPAGTRLIVGTVNGGYLVGRATLAARPLVGAPTRGGTSRNPGVNYTVAVVASRR